MTLVAALRVALEREIGGRRVLAWYDAGGTLERLAPLAIPDGLRFQPWKGSFLATRTAFEKEDPALEHRWIVYVPRPRLQPSWLRDLELAGESVDLGIAELVAREHGLALPSPLREALTGAPGRELAARWDELVDHHPPTVGDVRRAVLAAALRLTGSSLRDIVLGYVSDPEAPARLDVTGLSAELRSVLEDEGKLPLPEGGTVPVERVAAALVLSEAVSEGALDTTPFEQILPSGDAIARWAGWAEEWMRRSDPEVFVRTVTNIERRFDVASCLRIEGLERVQTLPAAETRLVGRVQELIEAGETAGAHAIATARRGSLWSRTPAPGVPSVPWDAIAAATELLERVGHAAEQIRARTTWDLQAILDAYAAQDGWWRFDDAYRRLEASWGSFPEGLLTGLAIPAATAYGSFLDALGAASASATEQASTWQAEGWVSQDGLAREELGDGEGVALILADALRLDLARLLAERLRSRRLAVAERPTLAALPSVTQVGMAAIQAPRWAEREATMVSGRLVPTVTGVKLIGRGERLEALKTRQPGALAVELDVVQDARRVPAGHPLVVYAGCIDEQGDSLPQVGLDLFELLVGAIADGVVKLLDAGYRKVVIIADHGFVLAPREHDLRVVEAPRGDATTARARRYAVGRPADTPGAIRVPLERLGWGGNDHLAIPVGLSVFALPGPVPRFFHGGPMPQEVAVLSLVVTREAGAVPVHVRVVAPSRVDTAIPRFTLEAEAEMFALPRRIRVVVRVDGIEAGSSDVVEIGPGDRIEVSVRLTRYGSSVEARIVDVDSGVAIETRAIPVDLPPGYDIQL